MKTIFSFNSKSSLRRALPLLIIFACSSAMAGNPKSCDQHAGEPKLVDTQYWCATELAVRDDYYVYNMWLTKVIANGCGGLTAYRYIVTGFNTLTECENAALHKNEH